MAKSGQLYIYVFLCCLADEAQVIIGVQCACFLVRLLNYGFFFLPLLSLLFSSKYVVLFSTINSTKKPFEPDVVMKEERILFFFFFYTVSFSSLSVFLLPPLLRSWNSFFFFTLINTSVELRTEEGSVFFFTAATVYTHTHTQLKKKKKNKKADGVYFFHRCHWSSRVIVAAGSFFFFFSFRERQNRLLFFNLYFFFFLCWCKQGEEWSWHPRCV